LSLGDRADIAAVETVRRRAQQEQIAWLEDVTAAPNWHRPMVAVALLGQRGDGAAHSDHETKSAHRVAHDCGDRLQNIAGALEIATPIGQSSEIRRKPDEREIVPPRFHGLNAVETNWDAPGRIPNHARWPDPRGHCEECTGAGHGELCFDPHTVVPDDD